MDYAGPPLSAAGPRLGAGGAGWGSRGRLAIKTAPAAFLGLLWAILPLLGCNAMGGRGALESKWCSVAALRCYDALPMYRGVRLRPNPEFLRFWPVPGTPLFPLPGSAPKMRVAIYARVSTDDKGQDPENQLRELRAWCVNSGHTIAGEYVDAESGRKGADKRKRFGALFDDAAKRKFDCVLFWALDRFSREGMAQTIGHL